ncbi:unnamed protein product [Citrullus colocynthis]|uniref:Uncharacterized protein n=1 Tax=Citrullus colocynthis TaxID=252529 RepID=A0ABP0YR15_9ROSI
MGCCFDICKGFVFKLLITFWLRKLVSGLHPPPPTTTHHLCRVNSRSENSLSSINLDRLPLQPPPHRHPLGLPAASPYLHPRGACDGSGVTRHLTVSLLALLALSCFLASFTDSVTVSGKVYYRIATLKGLLLVDYRDPAGGGLPDLTKKRPRIIDGVHAALSVLVFGAVVLRDRNVVSCLYPSPGPAARGF